LVLFAGLARAAGCLSGIDGVTGKIVLTPAPAQLVAPLPLARRVAARALFPSISPRRLAPFLGKKRDEKLENEALCQTALNFAPNQFVEALGEEISRLPRDLFMVVAEDRFLRSAEKKRQRAVAIL
jgi:hypothetical protein